MELHAENGIEAGERTACGLTLLDETDDGDGPAILAAPGSVVTCIHCRMIIAAGQDLYTANFRRRRSQPGREQHGN